MYKLLFTTKRKFKMKKIILLTLCLVSFAAQAQQVHFTPKLGVNIASMTNAEGTDSRIGLNAGVSGEISLTPDFAVEPGVFYSMQGITASESGVDMTWKNDYINVPVLAKYYLYEGLNLFAGPQVGFLINSEMDVKDSDVSASVDTKEMFKAIDFALVLGVGYQTAMGLNFSANYNLGLMNVIENGSANIAGVDIDLKEKRQNTM
jgi:hypothetical protein